jgi:hypothetical protein
LARCVAVALLGGGQLRERLRDGLLVGGHQVVQRLL